MHALFLGDFQSFKVRQSVAVAMIAILGTFSSSALLFAQPAQNAPAQDPKLPPEVQLPGPKSELVGDEYNNPKITLDEYNSFKPKMQAYMAALRTGDSTGQAKSLLEEGIRIQVLAMSLTEKDKRAEIDQMRKSLVRNLNNYAGMGEPNERRQRAFRSFVFDIVIKHSQELLDNNLFVRLQAVTLLNQLEITKADRRNRIPAEPYANVLPALRAIVVDPKQDTAVKIIAVRGIQRLASSKQVSISGSDMLATAEELVSELKRKTVNPQNGDQVFFAYPQILMDALRSTGIEKNRPGQPFIVQALAEVIADKTADPRVRSHAAFTIVRVPILSQVKLSVISYQVASLADELSSEFNKAPQKFYWPECFFKIYAAYQSLNDDEVKNNIGLLLQSKLPAFSTEQNNAGATIDITGLITEAYQTTLPIVRFVLDNERGNNTVPNGTSAPLGEWLKKNSPDSRAIAPGLKELSSIID